MERIYGTKLVIGNDHEVNLFQDDVPFNKIVKAFVDKADNQRMDDAVFIVNLDDIVNKYKVWSSHLPGVKPFYAVKANNDYVVLHMFAKLGVNFDCASKDEIERVLSLGVSSDRIVYSHPCKHDSMLKFAAESMVTMTTFDNADELFKINAIYPGVRCLIRLRPSTKFKVKVQLGDKYGCHKHEVEPLLKMAKSFGLNVIGVHFHVGYLCQEAAAYQDAICMAREVFDMGKQLEFDMKILDIGGGFPGKHSKTSTELFKMLALSINNAVRKYFSDEEITVIAEPGEYFVASAFTLATKIIARKVETSEQVRSYRIGDVIGDSSTKIDRLLYYLNDGFYGSFANVPEFSAEGVFPHHFKKDKVSTPPPGTMFQNTHRRWANKAVVTTFGRPTSLGDQNVVLALGPDMVWVTTKKDKRTPIYLDWPIHRKNKNAMI